MTHMGHYVQNTPAYFKSSTTFHSLSGHHILSQTVKVERINNLTLPLAGFAGSKCSCSRLSPLSYVSVLQKSARLYSKLRN